MGGSHTAAALSRASLEILGRAEGPGAALRPGGASATAAIVAEVVARAARAASVTLPVDRAVVGAAGAGRAPEQDELRSALASHGLARALDVVADGEIAVAAAFGEGGGSETEGGILVSAGTGSVAHARDRHGHLYRSGGYGWQLGDEGGGYWIGRRALAAAAKAHDRGEGTALLARLLAALGVRDFESLVRWASVATPPQVAALAPHLLNAAQEGDVVAQDILAAAATELVHLVLALLSKFPANAPVTVATSGGLLRPESPLSTAFREALHQAAPRVHLGTQPVDAPLGALRLAAKLCA